MSFNQSIADFKQVSIIDLLHSVGIEPARSVGKQLVYCSPLTGEQSPSFYVEPNKNVFNCFSSGEKGDVVRLALLMEGGSYKKAFDRLRTIKPDRNHSFSFSGQPSARSQSNTTEGMQLIQAKPLENSSLIAYVRQRAIPLLLATQYLHEVHYLNRGQRFFSLGFKTDVGSYALRNAGFKGWLGQSMYTTVSVQDSPAINLFEGFFNFLSALAYYQLSIPNYTTIILNSTTNLNQALRSIQQAQRINCFLDNDHTGRKTIQKLKTLEVAVQDQSYIYSPANDFNEMLQKRVKNNSVIHCS